MSQTQDNDSLFPTDTAAPVRPTITTIVDAAGPLAGYIPPTGLASDAQPTVMGTGVAGDIINLYDNTTLLGTVLVDASGRWSFQPQTALSGGAHELVATQSNGAQTSAASASYPFSVAQILVTGVTASDGTNVPANGTAHGAVTLTGWIADANVDPASVFFYVSGGNMTNGSRLFTDVTVTGHTFTAVMRQDSTSVPIFPVSMTDGTYHINASAGSGADRVLTVSDQRMGFTFTEYWTSTTPAPVFLGINEHTLNGINTVAIGGTTHDASPVVVFTTVPGDTYTMYDNGQLVGTVVAKDGQIGWTMPALPNGLHSIEITHTNADGTSAPLNLSFIIDATPPAAPTVTAIIDASGPLAGNISPGDLASDAQPKITGTGHAGDTINVFDHATLLGTALVDSTGRWSFVPQTPLTGGAHEIIATQSDGVHISTPGVSYPFSVAQIMVTGVTMADGTSVANGDAAHGPITVTGWIADSSITADKINLYVSGGNVGRGVLLFTDVTVTGHTFSAVVSNDSTVSSLFAVSMTDGTYHFDARAETASGNILTVSDARMGFTVTETWSDTSHQVVAAHSDAADAAIAASSHTVDISGDPALYFKSSAGHVAGSADGVHTMHLSGDHSVLDLTSVSGKTAGAKMSGIDSIDLGGAHNTLKLSLVDVLNLGQPDLFQHDGKSQMIVNGSNGDSVDLSSTHIAGVADGHWQQAGATQVGGVTYNVYEHSGAHAELLVQQGVQIALHG